ncbi:MAG: hypothetical protein DWQ40_00355 [Actinobacteria bacterium]|nr:MAG: hypothetical protein DWQ40_00355 [Actinomycetota bacterium]REK35579.1 MAG: hypothetical protein DWQ20_06030 [Actinomycetota bacterium]
MSDSFVELAQATTEVLELRAALDRTQKMLGKEKRRTGRIAEAAYRAAHEAALARPVPKVPIPRADRRTAAGGPEVAVAWISDLQLGKKTPDYDSDVCRERMGIYAKKVRELVGIQRTARPIDTCHVWMTGDMVEGEDIFPGQTWLIDSSLYAQTVKNGPEITAQFLMEMLAEFREVHVTAVIGNHGRIGRKGMSHPETNTDRMLYDITRKMLSGEDRLTWNIPEPGNSGDRGWYAVDTIGNYSSLLVHGDQFRGSLGVPWYGIRKKVLGWKAMSADRNLAFPEFQDLAFGHWHQPITWTVNGIGIRGIGSPESRNDYAAENFAGMSRPSQRLLFVDPEAGQVTVEYPEIWLDG